MGSGMKTKWLEPKNRIDWMHVDSIQSSDMMYRLVFGFEPMLINYQDGSTAWEFHPSGTVVVYNEKELE